MPEPAAPPAAELLACLRLIHAEGVGPVTFRRLTRVFGSPEAVLTAPRARLLEVPEMSEKVAAAVLAARSDPWAEQEWEEAQRLGVRLLTLSDPAYPKALLQTYDPPPVLYVQGELRPEDAVAVAIVGTRRCSHYGRAMAEKLAAGLALAGFTVVSGLARGIDSAAHLGALGTPAGRTLTVLGNSLDTVYPPENKPLYERITAGRGAALSELPFRAPPAAENFPRRNRIIAGLSLGVVVVEGPEDSGALITARFAVDMDREVFAVPGPVGSPNSRGPHRLIKQGATLVEDVEDILRELHEIATPLVKLPKPDERLRLTPEREKAGAQSRAERQAREDRAPTEAPEAEAPLLDAAGVAPPEDTRPVVADLRALNLNQREALVFGLLDETEARGIDKLISESHLQPHEVLATLLVLEVRRLCRQLPGKRFVKA